MTGIEQLRKLGADAVRGGEVGRAICDIADQIERERACDSDTIENLRLELGEARDHAAGVSTSAYDFLPQEDRDAIAWVRERGGLEMVKSLIETNVWAHSLAIIAHEALFGEDDEREVTPTEFKHELDRRLMPEGIEWPRFEDDAPVRFEDEWCLRTGGTTKVGQVVLATDGGFAINATWYEPGERVKRPAPKVLDADGVDTSVGDTVYDRDGETDTPLTVVDVSSDLVRCEYTWKDGKTYRPCYLPDQLTHQRPDTWERIEDDAGCTATKYNERRGTTFTTKQQVARDLVRRARALAEELEHEGLDGWATGGDE